MRRRLKRSRARDLLVASALGIALIAPAARAADGQERLPIETRRISVASDGTQANDSSEYPIMSEDGRIVVFSSDASNLVPQETVAGQDVFVHDRVTGTTRLASVNSNGEPANGRSFHPTISPDGRYIVYYSFASNLVEGTSGSQVYRHDLHTGATEVVSVNADGAKPNGHSITIGSTSAVSRGGRYVVYGSTATDIVPGTPPTPGNHIYLRDMVDGTNKLISIDVEGKPATLNTQTATISPDGNVVAFETRSPLDPRDTNGTMDVYVRDHITGKTEWVSTNDRGEPGNDSSWRGRLNEDGSIVAFDSSATNFVPLDQGSLTPDVFIRDRTTGRTVKIGTDFGEAPNDIAYRGSVSADGRFVAFHTHGSNLVSADERPLGDLASRIGNVYLYDRLLSQTELLSIPAAGGFGNNTSQVAGLSGNGEAVAFQSFASNLVAGDTNGQQDAFARQIGPPLGFVQPPAARVSDGTLSLAATVRATGELLARSEDDLGDLAPVQDVDAVAGDIVSASLAYRTSAAEQLLFSVLVDHLPTETVAFGYPGVTYGVAFAVDGVAHEIRMSYNGSPRAAPPTFHLFRCEPACVPLGETKGGFGRLGNGVQFAVSMDDLAARPGSTVTGIRGFVALGSVAGSVAPLDEIRLPDGVIPQVSTAVALGGADEMPSGLEWSDLAAGEDSTIAAELPIDDLSDGSYLGWARICLGEACTYGSAPFQIGEGGGDLLATQMTLDVARVRGRIVATAVLTTTDGVPLGGRDVSFDVGGATATASTDAAGRAVYSWAPTDVKPGDVITARFTGDDTHAPAEASRQFNPNAL